MQTRATPLPGQYLTFVLKGQYYAVPIATVREINRVTDITPVPQAPDFVAGVMNLRGKVIPVADLRLRLGMARAEATRNTCIIIIEAEKGQVGMLVDSVSGVIELAATQIEIPPRITDGGASHLMGMGKQEEQVILLLDIVMCLSHECLSGLKSTEPAASAA